MKRLFVYGTAVLALSAAPLFAQAGGSTSGQSGTTSGQGGTTSGQSGGTTGSGGATDQGGSRNGAGSQGGSTTGTSGTGTTSAQSGSTSGTQSGSASGTQKNMKAGASNMDGRFVMEAAQGGMAEVELGRLAGEKASNDRVKQFGQRMVTDHSKANDELKSLAQSKNITIPADLDAKHKSMHDRLAKLSGDAFDRAYIQQMVEDHRKDVSDFRKQSQNGKDPEVKAWAAKTLPTLEEHMKMVQDINQSLGHGAVGTSGNNSKGKTGGSTGSGATGTSGGSRPQAPGSGSGSGSPGSGSGSDTTPPR
jgi:putative membrane protein